MIGTQIDKNGEPRYSEARIKLLQRHNIIWWFTVDGLLVVLDQWTIDGNLFESPMLCPKTVKDTKEWLGY